VAVLAGYQYFWNIAQSLQWDEQEIDLSADAAAWPTLSPGEHHQVMSLIAGFAVAEWAVADELPAFAGAIDDPAAADVLRMQDGDEGRHSRFFDRVVAEVVQTPGTSRDERRAGVRGWMSAEFLRLFEEELPARAARVGSEGGVSAGIGLYHMVLEGIVLIAGQFAFFEVLNDIGRLPGLRQGVELVHRDERWHVGFGARCLQDLNLGPDAVERILAEGEEAVSVWGSVVPEQSTQKMLQLHRRRLRATGLLPKKATA
jgi:ribonucleoside-diphosphate reductase beta chain